MSNIAIKGAATGSGTFTLEAPATSTNRTLTLPDEDGTIITTTSLPSIPNPLTSGTAVATTSGTAIDLTGIPSWAKRVTVMIAGVKQNNSGGNPFKFRLGTSGGIVSSGYVGSAGYFGGGPASVSSSDGFDISFDTNTWVYSGSLVLTNVSGNVWVGAGTFGQNQGYQFIACAYINLGAALTQVRFTTNNGTNTFTAGSINIMYE